MTSKDKEIDKSVGKALAKYRKLRGLSQARVAELMSLSNDAVSRMERGNITLSVPRLFEFAKVLNCGIVDLLVESSANESDQIYQLNTILNQLNPKERADLVKLVEKMVSWKLEK